MQHLNTTLNQLPNFSCKNTQKNVIEIIQSNVTENLSIIRVSKRKIQSFLTASSHEQKIITMSRYERPRVLNACITFDHRFSKITENGTEEIENPKSNCTDNHQKDMSNAHQQFQKDVYKDIDNWYRNYACSS